MSLRAAVGTKRRVVLSAVEAAYLRGKNEDEVKRAVDAVVDSGDCGTEPTTVIDLCGAEPEIVRRGAGDPSRFE